MTTQKPEPKAQKAAKEKKTLATISYFEREKDKRILPSAPDANEERILAAEKEIASPDHKDSVVRKPTGVPPRGGRRKKKQPATESMLVKGPKPVIDAFNKYKDEEGFRSSWAALEQLLLNSGVNMPDFDA